MRDGGSLLIHCVLLPRDGTARLVFADWLDENGFAKLARRARTGGKAAWVDKINALLKLSRRLGRLPSVALLDRLCSPRITLEVGRRLVATASFLNSYHKDAAAVIVKTSANGFDGLPSKNLIRIRVGGNKTACTFHKSYWMDDPEEFHT